MPLGKSLTVIAFYNTNFKALNRCANKREPFNSFTLCRNFIALWIIMHSDVVRTYRYTTGSTLERIPVWRVTEAGQRSNWIKYMIMEELCLPEGLHPTQSSAYCRYRMKKCYIVVSWKRFDWSWDGSFRRVTISPFLFNPFWMTSAFCRT